jgi:hypothetical protein
MYSNSNAEIGTDKTQLPLFRLNHSFISIRDNWWMRGVAYLQGIAAIDILGHVVGHYASVPLKIRPAFAIKA